MDDEERRNILHHVLLQVNPTLDALNDAFARFSRVATSRPSISVASMVEIIREDIIHITNVITMECNTGYVIDILSHLDHARDLTHKITYITPLVREQHERRGFYVAD
ncbi:Protein CBG17438 [Caenorhabditis briggsae]|uniref:Uncharacterized protein n=2 Tax=Caenorhabditis briggsae TaxID=6238 RepID=A0AAE9JQQ5_CAEBR|nr:Protein CBG17438 [Caenorhabditis briggsae]ULT81031.1 hypothetical protein L3Y34_011121 [Caenorhabditis briggsae]UMM40324.1 hypothetical protein L5515_017000 [Caenorhabditis briggsae]CAP35088.1 Protein CBG17438 [Caenorhabditis briggsae]